MSDEPVIDLANHAGCLYVVATPIGNLEDLSPRAQRILSEVNRVAAEDTRRTRELLTAFDIHVPLMSLHAHNEAGRTPEIIDALAGGEAIALVSDAGVPTISDPGGLLIAEVAALGGKIVPIPGPSAAVTALSVSGLATERFVFVGFLSPKPSRRRGALKGLCEERGTLIFYEGKSRIRGFLQAIDEVLGPRKVVVCRELTKRHEEILRGSAAEIDAKLSEQASILGEFTVVVEGAPEQRGGGRVERIRRTEGVKELSAEVARVLGIPKKEAYQALLALKPAYVEDDDS